MKTLTNRDIEDLSLGCTLTNCGGGGGSWIDRLRQSFPTVFDAKSLQLADPNSFDDDDLVFQVSPCGGGVDPETLKLIKVPKRLPLLGPQGFVALAGKKLAEKMGEEPKGYLAFENGVFCNLVAMEEAVLNHKPVIDASPVGRAVPELCLSTLNVRGFLPECAVLTSPFGDTLVIENVFNYERFEEINRFFAASCGGGSGFAIPLRGKHLKNAVEQQTVSQTIEIGRMMRNAKERNKKIPIEELLTSYGYYKIFEGEVTSVNIVNKLAYEAGDIRIKGSGSFNGKTLRILQKNENVITWLDEELYVAGPDHIVTVDPKTAKGLGDHELTVGMRVSVVGRKAGEIWRTKEGLEVFSPKHFGFDLDYKPIEEFF